MADANIPVGAPTSTSQRLDAEQLTVGADTVVRERMQIAGAAATEIARVTGTDPPSGAQGLVTREAGPRQPVTDLLTATALAAGASATLNGAVIANARTGKVRQVILASSAACKWVVATRAGATVVDKAIVYTSGLAGGRPSEVWAPPRDFVTLAGNGTDTNFRVTVTNLDRANPADASAAILFDEA